VDSSAIQRIIEITRTDPDFYVPVKKLWLMLQGEGLAVDMEIKDLYRMLANDKRFEFTDGMDHTWGFKDDPEFRNEIDREMEALGFYAGPRVKLVSREMTAEDVFAAMTHSVARMNEALQGAWDTRPEKDPELDNQLLDILAAGQKLEREIQRLIEEQERPPDKNLSSLTSGSST
jgi:hypothetical protein